MSVFVPHTAVSPPRGGDAGTARLDQVARAGWAAAGDAAVSYDPLLSQGILTALFTGSTGLQANSEALDVIGNNIANLNTTGFKTQSAQFKDLVYQTLSPGTAPTATTGGTDPVQQGFGVGVGAVSNLFTQGSVTPTGNSTDAAIQAR